MQRLLGATVSLFVAAIMAQPAIAAIVEPNVNLTLTAPNSTYNTLNMTVTLTSPISGSSTNKPTITGSCSTTFDALFNPANDQSTIPDITFNLQNPGQISLQNVTFSYVFGLETIKTNNVVLSPFTQTPPTPTPTPVSGGLFAANETWDEFNGGSIVAAGVTSATVNLTTSPIDTQDASSSSGTVAVSAPTMSGSVATYTATVTIPVSVNQPISGSGYAATIVATGTLQASGTFQFNFGPREVNWNVASGDYSNSGNWDVGFAPRSIDTAVIANGGVSTLSSAFAATPVAVWIGNGAGTSGTLTIASGGSLNCGAMVLGQSGASGTLVLGGGTLAVPSISQGSGGAGTMYFNGGTLLATSSNSPFLAGLNNAYVSAGGAVINSNGFNVSISQAFQSDPALGGGLDGGLLKTGGGVVTLTGASSYTGPTTVSSGTLCFQDQTAPSADIAVNAGTMLQYKISQNLTQSGGTLSGAGTVQKTGTGTVVFGGNGNVYWNLGAGALIDVESGTLVGGSSIQDFWTGNLSALNVAAGAEFNGVEANVRVDALTGGGTVASGWPGSGYANFTFGVNGGSGTFSGVLADASAPANFVKAGGGLQVLTGTSTYTGSTTVNAGTLQLGTGQSGQDGSITGAGGVTDNAALVYDLAGSQAVSYAVSGSGSLAKTGPGTLVLAASQAYSGPTLVNAGTVQLNVPGAGQNVNVLPAATALSIASGGTLDLYGAEQQVGSLSGSGTVTNSSSALSTLTVDNSAATTFSGSINGAGGGIALEKIGPGTLVLSGTDSYEGGTTVLDGTLVFAQSAAFPQGTQLIVGDAAAFGSVLAASDAGSLAAAVTAVPEPGTLAIALAILAAGVIRLGRLK